MQLNLMKKATIYSMLFSVAALGVIFYAAGHLSAAARSAVQEEMTPAGPGSGDASAGTGAAGRDVPGAVVGGSGNSGGETNNRNGRELVFGAGEDSTNYLCIPLPAGTRAAAVTVENHYMDEEMWVVVQGAAADFYETAVISGNRQHITQGVYEAETGRAVLKFSLSDIFEYRSILEENRLYVECVPPREMYERIIVIDPAFGGSETGREGGGLKEKDVAMAVTVRLKELLDEEEIKVYYTRLDDNNLSDEKRVRIANNTRADLLIRIEANADEDSTVHGTTAIYNEDFFIPGFGSIELANVLEREVVSNIKGKAVGLVAATAADYVIRQATVPAATLRVGYLTNAQEAILLNKADYIEKIAIGIYRAVMAAYEEDEKIF